jgi:hypothetical protein
MSTEKVRYVLEIYLKVREVGSEREIAMDQKKVWLYSLWDLGKAISKISDVADTWGSPET